MSFVQYSVIKERYWRPEGFGTGCARHISFSMAQWLSWLERRPVTAEVTGSSPVWVVYKWDLSSAGRASALQAEGHRFEPYRSHLKSVNGYIVPE